jgi:hypothetical protein
MPHIRQKALASLVLSGFFQTGSDPTALGRLLDGTRLAASTLELDDPRPHVTGLLRVGLLNDVGPEAAPRLFAH